MPLKLIVNKIDDPAAQPESFVFQQERITIGRDSTNDLPLDDTKRVSSKQHAELVVGGASVHLTDLGSKNFTYLNGNRLEPGEPYPVRPGDTIRIADFEISVNVIDAVLAPPRTPALDHDQTIFAAGFVNPFEDDAKLLAVALRSLSKQYDDEAPNRRDDALIEALHEAMEGDVEHVAFRQVSHILAREAAAPAPEPPVNLPPSPVFDPPPEPTFRADLSMGDHEDRHHTLLDRLLHAMARLVGVPWQFRHEFLGQTIIQTGETAFLYEGDVDVLKRHLLDPAVSDEEMAHRLSLLEDALAALERHQIAILDGYKAAVRDGALSLIDLLNPEALAQQAAEEKTLYRLLPFLAKAEALERLQAQLREMRSEDWSATERRTYRPAFTKAYLNRMTAAPPSEPFP